MKNTIGNIIKNYCYDKHIKLNTVAAKINYNRTSLYKTLSRSDISVNTLLAISQAVNHNFFQYLWVDKTIPSPEELSNLKTEISQLREKVSRLSAENDLLRKITSRN